MNLLKPHEFKSDQPIYSKTEDLLSRTTFSDTFADSIISYMSKDSLVLGLNGAWGSGKTSLLNLVIERLTAAKDCSYKKPIVINFNPWNFSEQNQLINNFFTVLTTSLNRKENSDSLIKIGKILEEYSDIFTPLSVIPVIGPFISLSKPLVRYAGTVSKNIGEMKKKDIDGLRKEIDRLLVELDSKIVVIIDDIDRLTPQEICHVFQLVKKIADFKNIVYILSYDKNVILNALKPIHGSFANSYLEKIIQVSFDIPPIPQKTIHQYLFRQIDKIVLDFPQDDFSQGYWANIFHSGFNRYFNSLRDVNRFINTFSFGYSIVKDRINIVDFLAITAIQVFDSKLYHFIRSNIKLFAGSSDAFENRNSPFADNDKSANNGLLANYASIPEKQYQEFLTYLFPKLSSVFRQHHYGQSWSSDWRKNQRICSEDCFHNYFNLVFDISEINPNEIRQNILLSKDYANFHNQIKKMVEDNRILTFMEYFGDYLSDSEMIPDANVQNIISVFMDLGDTFPEEEKMEMFSIDVSVKIMRIIFQLSHRFDEHDLRFNLYKTAIEKSINSIYTIVREVGILCQEHAEFQKVNPIPLDRVSIKPEQLDILRELAVNKIEEWAEKPELINHNHLGAIIYRWKEWRSLDRVKEFVANITTEDYGLVNFIRAFLSRRISTGIGEYRSKVTWQINLKDMSEFIEPDKFVNRIRALNNSSAINSYSEKNQLAVKTFLDFYDGKRSLDD